MPEHPRYGAKITEVTSRTAVVSPGDPPEAVMWHQTVRMICVRELKHQSNLVVVLINRRAHGDLNGARIDAAAQALASVIAEGKPK